MFNKFLITAIVLMFTVLAGCQNKGDKTENFPAADSQKTEQSGGEDRVTKVHYYPSGAVETETEYVNGVRNGMHKLYDEEGHLISEVLYVNNKMEGMMRTYYPDGAIKVIVPYEKGLVNGEMLSYYPDGKIWRRGVYEQGKLISNKSYKPDGTLDFEDKLK